MTHDELAQDLASHLRGASGHLVWTDMQMGSAGSPRPDVWALPTTYSGFRPLSYEIKVSVADFRADVTSGKWQKYLEFSAGVVFACELGLISKADLPGTCGLICRGPSGQWRSVKRATLHSLPTLPREAWMKLVMDGCRRERASSVRDRSNKYLAAQKVRRKFGDLVADVVGSVDAARGEIERAQASRELEEERARLEREAWFASRMEIWNRSQPEVRRLMDVLGVSPGPDDIRQLAGAIRRAEARLSQSEVLADAVRSIRRAKDQVEIAERGLTVAMNAGKESAVADSGLENLGPGPNARRPLALIVVENAMNEDPCHQTTTEGDARDAARYRHLRSPKSRNHAHHTKRCLYVGVADWGKNLGRQDINAGTWSSSDLTGVELDSAIDADIAATGKGAS